MHHVWFVGFYLTPLLTKMTFYGCIGGSGGGGGTPMSKGGAAACECPSISWGEGWMMSRAMSKGGCL